MLFFIIIIYLFFYFFFFFLFFFFFFFFFFVLFLFLFFYFLLFLLFFFLFFFFFFWLFFSHLVFCVLGIVAFAGSAVKENKLPPKGLLLEKKINKRVPFNLSLYVVLICSLLHFRSERVILNDKPNQRNE